MTIKKIDNDKRRWLKHPVQPLCHDHKGTIRFKPNEIVRFLLDEGPFDLNHLAAKGFDREDYEQFAQLIGYSLGGFGELSYVSDDTFETAERMSEGESEDKARIKILEDKLAIVRNIVKGLVPELFRIHEDDLDDLES